MSKAILQPTNVIKAELGIDSNGPVQKFFQETCYQYMDKYVPYRTGQLAYYTVDLSNPKYIVYDCEHAMVQYTGVRLGKQIVNKKSAGHEYAGSYWDQRMWTAEGQDVTKLVQQFIDKGGK